MHACATTKWLALVHIHLHLSFFSVIVECPLRMHIERVRFLTRVWWIKNFLSVAQQGKLPSIHTDQKCMQPLHSAYTTIEVAAQSLGLGVWIVRRPYIDCVASIFDSRVRFCTAALQTFFLQLRRLSYIFCTVPASFCLPSSLHVPIAQCDVVS
jgi:hypothetical protein